MKRPLITSMLVVLAVGCGSRVGASPVDAKPALGGGPASS